MNRKERAEARDAAVLEMFFSDRATTVGHVWLNLTVDKHPLKLSKSEVRTAFKSLLKAGKITNQRHAQYRYVTDAMRQEWAQKTEICNRGEFAAEALVRAGFEAWHEGRGNVGLELASAEELVKLLVMSGIKGCYVPAPEELDEDD